MLPISETAPFFSIITPCCDVEPYLRECLESILEQPCCDWECLLEVEDSKDASEPVAREFAAADSRFRVSTSPRSGGCSAPRNRGIEKARGEYIVFLDGDDVLIPGALARVRDAIVARPGADLYPCALQVHNDITHLDEELRDNFPKDAPAELTGPEASILAYRFTNDRLHVQLSLTVFRRHFLLDHSLRCLPGIRHEDSEFTPRALYIASRVVPLHIPLYVYRIRPNSIMTAKTGLDCFLDNVAVVFHSLLCFHGRVSRTADFDRRVAVHWGNEWISRIIGFWFGASALRLVSRKRRRESLKILFSDGFADFDRLLRTASFRHRVAAIWIRLSVRHPALSSISEWFFSHVYNRLSDWKKHWGVSRSCSRKDIV